MKVSKPGAITCPYARARLQADPASRRGVQHRARVGGLQSRVQRRQEAVERVGSGRVCSDGGHTLLMLNKFGSCRYVRSQRMPDASSTHAARTPPRAFLFHTIRVA
eukprot:6190482-Pleurochrysis_carterae.AAC.3